MGKWFTVIYDNVTSLCVTVRMVAEVIAKLDPSKATGPDGIPSGILQRCSPELAPLLSKLFNKLLSESCFRVQNNSRSQVIVLTKIRMTGHIKLDFSLCLVKCPDKCSQI